MRPTVRAVVSSLAFGVALLLSFASPAGPKDKLGAWQIVVGADQRCFEFGERAKLQLNYGTRLETVARLRVIHIDRAAGVITYVEDRRP